jgi:hypothetical protein
MPVMIAAGIGAVANIAGGLLGGRSAKKAAEAQRRAAEEAERRRLQMFNEAKAGLTTVGNNTSNNFLGLAGMAPSIYEFNPVTAKNNIGSVQYDPATGQMVTNLSGEYEGYRGMFGEGLNAATQSLQGMNYDPNMVAQDWMAKQQGLLAPGRTMQLEQLAGRMNALGVGGIRTNTAAQGNGVVAINPHTAALTNSWANEDARLAAAADQMGQNRLDQLLGRQAGMFGRVLGVDQTGMELNRLGMGWQGQASPFQLGGANAQAQALSKAYGIPLEVANQIFNGAMGMMGTVGQGAIAGGQSQAAGHMGNAAMFQGIGSGISSFLTGPGAGMFGGGGQSYGSFMNNAWQNGFGPAFSTPTGIYG